MADALATSWSPAPIRAHCPRCAERDRFAAWWSELRRMAIARQISWLLGAPEDHQEGFYDGNSPEQELAAQLAEASGLI